MIQSAASATDLGTDLPPTSVRTPYIESREIEEAIIEPSGTSGVGAPALKFIAPPGNEWDELTSGLFEEPVLKSMVPNPLLELQKQTSLIVFNISLASPPSIADEIQAMEKQIRRFFRQIPVLIVLTHFESFFNQLPNDQFEKMFPEYAGDTVDDAMEFIAKEILARLKPYCIAKVRLVCSCNDQETVVVPTGIKWFDEFNAYHTFLETFHLLQLHQAHATHLQNNLQQQQRNRLFSEAKSKSK
eukprot:c10338_g1_i2.p1 GENE.c10338_g1_i2~~c10338_g1_i2.p1  ORF type:complete len:244 (+),score=60.37 c10338_g1_i2:407-1138(+)